MKISFAKNSILLLIPFLLLACGKSSFQTSSSGLQSDSSNNSSNNGGSSNPALAEEIQKLDLSGFASSNYADGQETINLDKSTGDIILKIPLGFLVNVSLTANTSAVLPGLQISTEFDATKGQLLVLRLPVRYLLRDIKTAAPGRLPNGDALPSVPSGELPMVNIVINSQKSEQIYLYLSKEYFAVFFETKVDFGSLLNPLLPINPISMISIPIKDKNKVQIVGYLHLIAKKNNYNGGFMMAFRLPPRVASLLDDFFME